MNTTLTPWAYLCPVTAAVALAAGGPAAHAAVITTSTSFEIVYTSPSSKNAYDFTVAGFDSTLGDLTGVYLELVQDAHTVTQYWTLRNDTSETISGTGAYQESHAFSLRRADNQQSLLGSTISSTPYGSFSVAPGAQTTETAFGPYGSDDRNLGSFHRAYFNTPGDVALRLETEGIGLDLSPGLTVVDQGGAFFVTATVNVRYTYDSNEPVPPPPATPIAISSTTDATLAAPDEVDWFVFEYLAGELTIDTADSPEVDDTTIALYDATGDRIAFDDDNGPGWLSLLHFDDGELDPGTYYLAVTGYGGGNDFGDDFGVTSVSTETGAYRVNLTGKPVPEPATLALFLGLAGAATLRRSS